MKTNISKPTSPTTGLSNLFRATYSGKTGRRFLSLSEPSSQSLAIRFIAIAEVQGNLLNKRFLY